MLSLQADRLLRCTQASDHIFCWSKACAGCEKIATAEDSLRKLQHYAAAMLQIDRYCLHGSQVAALKTCWSRCWSAD